MERIQIQAFLDIVRYGNISVAAEKNYTSQSYFSNLIKSLEAELGVSLLIRQKGKRTIELTEQGKQFFQLAEQYKTIWTDMESIGKQNIKDHLIIGSNAAIPNLFESLFKDFLKKYPNIVLDVHIYHSRELFSRLRARSIDLAFVHNIYDDPNIVVTPLFEEPMYLICNKKNNYHNDMNIFDLPHEKEIYTQWNKVYQQWHQRYFQDGNYLIRITDYDILHIFLDIEEAWTIGPLSICTFLKNQGDYDIFTIKQTPQNFKCYQLENRYPRPLHLKAIECFKKELNDYLSNEKTWFMFPLKNEN